MDNQPSKAAIEAAYAALLEHERLDLDPPYPTKGDIMLVDPLVVVVADHVERYAAEQVRAAYEAAAHLAYTRAAQIHTEHLPVSAVNELNALGDKLAECANQAANKHSEVRSG